MIEKGKHYFILSAPVEPLPFLGLGMRSGDPRDQTWAEFEIIEDRYNRKDGDKVELKAIDPRFGRETFYQRDFEGLIEAGCIIEKTGERQHVEHIKWIEPLCDNIILVNEADIVVNE